MDHHTRPVMCIFFCSNTLVVVVTAVVVAVGMVDMDEPKRWLQFVVG